MEKEQESWMRNLIQTISTDAGQRVENVAPGGCDLSCLGL